MPFVGQNVLVTGGCGFIASNFINYVHSQCPHMRFICYDNLSAKSSNTYNICDSLRNGTDGKYELITGSLNNGPLLSDTIQQFNIDCIVNMAAQSSVDRSYKNPYRTTKDNADGTACLMSVVRKHIGQIKRVVHVSTDEVYGDSDTAANEHPKKESDPLSPTNPYSASKAASEMILNAYVTGYNLPLLMVRMNNVYGCGQDLDQVIPKFIRTALANDPFPIHNEGTQMRGWLNVIDACRAIYKVLTIGQIGEIYNVGSDVELSILNLARLIKATVDQLLNRTDRDFLVRFLPGRPYNDQRYYIDASKLQSQLSWSPEVHFDKGLVATCQHYIKKIPVSKLGTTMVFKLSDTSDTYRKFIESGRTHLHLAECNFLSTSDQIIAEIVKVKPSKVIFVLDDKEERLLDSPEQLRQVLENGMFHPILVDSITNELDITTTFVVKSPELAEDKSDVVRTFTAKFFAAKGHSPQDSRESASSPVPVTKF